MTDRTTNSRRAFLRGLGTALLAANGWLGFGVSPEPMGSTVGGSIDFETAHGMLFRLHSFETMVPISRGMADWLAHDEHQRALERELGVQLQAAIDREIDRLILEG